MDFMAPAHVSSCSNKVPAAPSCRVDGLNTEKFSKSVNSENESCCRTWAICNSLQIARRCSIARAPPKDP